MDKIDELQEIGNSMLTDRVKDGKEMTDLMQEKAKIEKDLKEEISNLESKVDELIKVKKEYKEKQGKLKTKVESMEKKGQKTTEWNSKRKGEE